MKIKYQLIDSYTEEDEFNEFDFFPTRVFVDDVYILVHETESFGNIQFMDFFLECDKKDIRVNALATINYVPLLSLISHRGYTTQGNITNTFFSSVSRNCVNAKRFREYIKTKKKTVSLCRGNIIKRNIVNTNDDLIEFYKNKSVHIQRSAYDTFMGNKDTLPVNSLWCQLKKRHRWYGKFNNLVLEKAKNSNIIGHDNAIQKHIIDHLNGEENMMSFQLMGSMFLGWKFLSVTGPSSIFSMIPINGSLLSDTGENFKENMEIVKKKLNLYYYNRETIMFRNSHDYEVNGSSFQERHPEVLGVLDEFKAV